MGANVSFYGRLASDCDVRYLQSGSAVCSFSVPVKSGYGDREKTTWFRVAIFGKRAEGKLKDYLVKGQGVFVSGELSSREWEDKDGKQRTSLEVNANTVDLGERPSGGGQQSGSAGRPQASRPQSGEELDDDIPF